MSPVGSEPQWEVKGQVSEGAGRRPHEASQALTANAAGERLGKGRSCGQVVRHGGDRQRKASFKDAAHRGSL